MNRSDVLAVLLESAWISARIAGLLSLVVAFLVIFDWNWARGPVSRFASAQLQRPVRRKSSKRS